MAQLELQIQPQKFTPPSTIHTGYNERFLQLLHGNLDFHGKNSTYGAHAIPAKFPPQLPRLFINELTQAGEIVFDPMMGSGTTLLEAKLLGRHAIGSDIDPLALRIGWSKLKSDDVLRASEAGQRVNDKAPRSATLEFGKRLKRNIPLKNTVEAFVCASEAGCFAFELQELLHVPVHKPLRELFSSDKLHREQLSQRYLYLSPVKTEFQLNNRKAILEAAVLEKSHEVAPAFASSEVQKALRVFLSTVWHLCNSQPYVFVSASNGLNRSDDLNRYIFQNQNWRERS